MHSRHFDKLASIQLTNQKGNTRDASAIFHQDPQFLATNRISLLGTYDQSIGMMGFGASGVVEWQLHDRSDWKLSEDPNYKHIERGKGIIRSTGMTKGKAIADDSIQPFAEVEIIETSDELHAHWLEDQSAEFWFLQRPKDHWYVHQRALRKTEQHKLAAPWKKVPDQALRFRLLRIANLRDDERINQERERIDLPGVEIEPIEQMDDATFNLASNRLWFSIRVLLMFRYRQPIYTLYETRGGNQRRESTWHTIRLEPRYRLSPYEANDPPFRAMVEPYLAKGTARIEAMQQQRELLHAAVFAYANSYSAPAMEGRLTACIEGIERLVEAFEQVSGLTREKVDRKRWRTLGKAVRKQARTIDASNVEHQAIERMLTDVPKFHLLERIERLANSLPPQARKGPLELLENAPRMIKARNDIVHGRMVFDYNNLLIEQFRAQTLFEWLWLGFLGCGQLQTSNWALNAIKMHESDQ